MMNIKKHTKHRFILCIIGLFLITFGISLSVYSGLGVSSLSFIPYVLSHVLEVPLAFANLLFFFVLVALEYVILRKNFGLFHLLQIPFGLLFSMFIQLTQSIFVFSLPQQYWIQVVLLLLSLCFCAIGMYLYTLANIVLNAPEGFTMVLANKMKIAFPQMKILLDCLYVFIGICLSLFFLHELIGIREGTILSAILVGKFIRMIPDSWKKKAENYCMETS